MRTTVTLEPDVVSKLKAKIRKGDSATFKDALNDTLRKGFVFEEQAMKNAARPFKIRARNLKARPGINFDKISTLLELIEGPDFK